MLNTESYKHFIKKITKEYRREIIQEGSISVLELADYLDEIVAKAMNIDKDIITLAKQWHIALERAAFTEGIDKVKEVLGREQELATTQWEKANEVIEKIEIEITEILITEIIRAKKVESYETIKQNI